jgi:hypothetical protein
VDVGIGQAGNDELTFGVNDSRPIGTTNLARWPYILNSPIAKNNDPAFLRPAARTVDNRCPLNNDNLSSAPVLCDNRWKKRHKEEKRNPK